MSLGINFTGTEILVIALAFLIMFALLRLFKRDTLADRKREEIERKRAALIAKRKAEASAKAAESQSEN